MRTKRRLISTALRRSPARALAGLALFVSLGFGGCGKGGDGESTTARNDSATPATGKTEAGEAGEDAGVEAGAEAGAEAGSEAGTNTAAADPKIQADVLPLNFTLSDVSVEGVPNVHSYQLAATDSNQWLIIGGRVAGLHTFFGQEDNNFPRASRNDSMWVVAPGSGVVAKLPVDGFSPAMQRLLTSTNAQGYYDRSADILYLLGGYGPVEGEPPKDMGTQDTLMAIPVAEVIGIMTGEGDDATKAQKVEAAIKLSQDPFFQVTGGELLKMGNTFYLVFGQLYNGRYEAFGGDVDQKYTEQIRIFTLTDDLKILSSGSIPNSDASHPFHRRDGNIFDDVDPATGQPRITASGGVFPVGKIAGFENPIYIGSDQQYKVDTGFAQRFSAYECPVIVAYSKSSKTAYRNYFAGISHYWYHLTDEQKVIYNLATEQGRNDGLPFISDISTVVQGADGSSTEWIHPNTMPANELVGASVLFIPDANARKQGWLDDKGIVDFDAIPAGASADLGWIYGGISAQFPLPKVPNEGTTASGKMFKVTLNKTPSGAIPASEGQEANGTFAHVTAPAAGAEAGAAEPAEDADDAG